MFLISDKVIILLKSATDEKCTVDVTKSVRMSQKCNLTLVLINLKKKVFGLC